MMFDKIFKVIVIIMFVVCVALFFHTTRYTHQNIKTEYDGGAIMTTVFRYDTWTGESDIKYILSTITNQGTILISIKDIYGPFPKVKKNNLKWKKDSK